MCLNVSGHYNVIIRALHCDKVHVPTGVKEVLRQQAVVVLSNLSCVSSYLWTWAVVIQALVNDMVHSPVGLDQVLCQHAIVVLGREAACHWSQQAEALVVMYKAWPAQNVCTQVCMAPPQPARVYETSAEWCKAEACPVFDTERKVLYKS